MRKTIKIALFISLCIITFIFLFTLINGYDFFTKWLFLINLYTEGSKKDILLLHEYFPPYLYYLTLLLIFTLTILCSYTIYKFDIFYIKMLDFFMYLRKSISSIFSNIITKDFLIISAIPLLSILYFGITIPVTMDEALTYVGYANKPFYYCITHYPEPNNHILHTIILHFTKHIPIGNLLFKIRIPVIIISYISWIITYSFIKKYYEKKTALFIAGLFPVFLIPFMYSFLSRGYYLIFFFFIISFYASYNIIKKGSNNNDWTIFSLSSILGFYSMPSYLYPFVVINLMILIFNYKNIKQQFFYNSFIFISVILLYYPIILLDGLNALVNNPFVSPKDRLEVIQNLPVFFTDILATLTGISWHIVLSFIFIAFVLLYRNKEKLNLSISILWIFLPFLILIIHSVIPFHRTFSYYGFIIIFIIGISFRRYIDKTQSTKLIILIIFLQSGLLLNLHNKITEYLTYNIDVGKTHDNFLQKNKTYYISSRYSMYQFLFEIDKREYNIEKSFAEWPHTNHTNADTINTYDYIIIDKDRDATILKKPIYENPYQNVYMKD